MDWKGVEVREFDRFIRNEEGTMYRAPKSEFSEITQQDGPAPFERISLATDPASC